MEPFASLAGAVRSSVPRLLINRDLVGPFTWSRRPNDVAQLGDVVSGVQALVDALGWTWELDALMAASTEKVSASLAFSSENHIKNRHVPAALGLLDSFLASSQSKDMQLAWSGSLVILNCPQVLRRVLSVSALALQQTGILCRVYPASHPLITGIVSSPLSQP